MLKQMGSQRLRKWASSRQGVIIQAGLSEVQGEGTLLALLKGFKAALGGREK